MHGSIRRSLVDFRERFAHLEEHQNSQMHYADLGGWYNKVGDLGMKQFNVIEAIFYEYYGVILNFYNIVR